MAHLQTPSADNSIHFDLLKTIRHPQKKALGKDHLVFSKGFFYYTDSFFSVKTSIQINGFFCLFPAAAVHFLPFIHALVILSFDHGTG